MAISHHLFELQVASALHAVHWNCCFAMSALNNTDPYFKGGKVKI